METRRTATKPFGHREPFLYDLTQRHNENLRSLVYWLGEWDVRIYRPCSDVHRLLAVNGMYHLQLWHPESRTSLLTPTALTEHQFEVSPLFGGAFHSHSYAELAAVLNAARGIELPAPELLSDVFFAMFNEFVWHIPDALMPPVRFLDSVAAK